METLGEIGLMTTRIIKHEAVPQTGSFEVRFPDGRPSVYFYWDDVASRRLGAEQMDSKRALAAAKTLGYRAEEFFDRSACLRRKSKFSLLSAPVRCWIVRAAGGPNTTIKANYRQERAMD